MKTLWKNKFIDPPPCGEKLHTIHNSTVSLDILTCYACDICTIVDRLARVNLISYS